MYNDVYLCILMYIYLYCILMYIYVYLGLHAT